MVKHYRLIAIASVVGLLLILSVAVLTGPKQSPSTSTNDEQTSLTPEQQDRVNEKLNHCFASGEC